jgi:hypothetical protein
MKTRHLLLAGGSLFQAYRDPDDASTWVTDAGQIKIAAKAQELAGDGVPFLEQALATAKVTPIENAYAILGGMYLDKQVGGGGQPLLLAMGMAKDFFKPGHDVLVYAADVVDHALGLGNYLVGYMRSFLP